MNGILIVDKPQGITSHDVVDFVRRKFRIKKVGHAGTLDPMATGVLVVLVGKATKLSNILMNKDKEYEVVMSLGKRTDTGDADGKVIFENRDYSKVTQQMLENALTKFSGQILQVPPMVSAVRYKGKKLYELARRGIEVQRPPRPVTVKEMRLLAFNPPDILLSAKCSKGTYVRVLCDDIGMFLGCGGYVSKIKRVSSGEFSIKDVVSLQQLKNMTRQEFNLLLKNESYYKFTPPH